MEVLVAHFLPHPLLGAAHLAGTVLHLVWRQIQPHPSTAARCHRSAAEQTHGGIPARTCFSEIPFCNLQTAGALFA